MTESEFEYLLALHLGRDTKEIDGDTKAACYKNGYVADNKVLTKAAYDALAPYKVDNAVIMAAGRSRRCMPLSNYLPKGLFEIKGDTMVERQIKQLHDAGINNIVIVAGYLKEQYHKMAKKYDGSRGSPKVTIIDNDEWADKNNLFSLWAAKDHLKNTYVCCSDNWFLHNVFSPYVYDSYYACKYTDEFCDEYCVRSLDKDGYMTRVKKGGEKAWYTIGEAYFNKSFSTKFVELLQNELYDPELKYMLWDDFQIRHIDTLKMKTKHYNDDECKEFDTTEDILQFYPQFKDFVEQYFAEEELETANERLGYLSNYADTKQYSVVATEQKTGRLHVNENLFGPSPRCQDALKTIEMTDLYEYDLGREDALVDAISKKIDMPRDNILLHSGSSDVIKTVMTITLNRGDNVLISAPAWNYYKSVIELRLAKALYYDVLPDDDKGEYYFDVKGLMEQAKSRTPKIIVITTPHNPTGAIMSPRDLEHIIKNCPSSLVIVDEAYFGFGAPSFDIKRLLHDYSNVIFARTFSKLYGLAGIRVGYAICPAMAKQVFKLDTNPFRICNISRKLCLAALEDDDYYKKLAGDLISVRDDFCSKLNAVKGVKAFRTYANFVYIRFAGIDVQGLKDLLEREGYLVRLWTETARLSMRITLAPKEIMDKVAAIIKDFCNK